MAHTSKNLILAVIIFSSGFFTHKLLSRWQVDVHNHPNPQIEDDIKADKISEQLPVKTDEVADPPSSKATELPQPGEPNQITLFTQIGNKKSAVELTLSLESFVVIDDSDTDWITLQSKVGTATWIHNSMLQTVGSLGRITANNVNIRYSPEIQKYNIVSTINKGTIIQLLEHKNEWRSFVYPGTFNFWVKKSEVERGER